MDTNGQTMKSLPEHVADVLSAAPKPLAFSAIKSQLKAAKVPTVGKNKVSDASIQAAIDALVEDQKAFIHPDKKPEGKPKYWHKAHVSQANQAAEKAAEKERQAVAKAEAKLKEKTEKIIAVLRANVSGLGTNLVSEKQLGAPKVTATPAEHEAFKTALESLLAEQKLFRHREKFGTSPPAVKQWYETAPLKKSFADALKAVEAILHSGEVAFEGLVALLKEKVETKPPVTTEQSPTQKTAPHEPPNADLGAEVKRAYDHLCKFAEFRHRRVEIRRIYHEVKKSNTHLQVDTFHKELLDMSRHRVLELHALNEVSEAEDRELAIERDGRLLYYVIWN